MSRTTMELADAFAHNFADIHAHADEAEIARAALQSHVDAMEARVRELEAQLAEATDGRDFLIEHLKCWKDEGVPAPVNELQSIAAWLKESCDHKAMQDKMRKRMILLMEATNAIHEEGIDAEVLAGIYANRPDLEAEARAAITKEANNG